MSWVKRHRMITFFVLAYLVSWLGWLLHAAGVLPVSLFLECGPLVAALVVLAVTEGRRGLASWAARLIRWRVGWRWYAVALGLPIALVLVTAALNSALGADAPDWSASGWSGFALVFALRMINPLDAALGEEPGWRGYALPRLQADRSPLAATFILGLLVAGWHLPLVFDGRLGWIGLPSTVAITFVYAWLFNHTEGSVLLPVIFHAMQGAFTFGALGYAVTDLVRADYLYGAVLLVLAIGLVVFDRRAWRVAPPSAVEPAAGASVAR
jgi:uncharacterized protein